MSDRDPIITPVVQFGTSRFLQAHADLFFDQGDPRLTVTVVQSSGDPDRARRLAHLTDGYPVRIRGIRDGAVVDTETRVTCVRRTLSTAHDWDALSRVVTHEARLIVSNTSDRGFDPQPADDNPTPDQGMSYPAKLYHLLAARQAAGKAPLDIFPMELVPENGAVLCARVMQIATAQHASAALTGWLSECRWANSLVDRIVSEPIEPAGAVAEPYALWAIEAQPGLSVPTIHSAIRMVDDLERIERLKLHLLNLGHTAMVQMWRDADGDPGLTVDAAMSGQIGRDVAALIASEVIPGFALHGMQDEATDYAAATFERFRNPFLHHRLSDIAQNHDQKIARRIGAFLDWARVRDADFAAPILTRIVGARG